MYEHSCSKKAVKLSVRDDKVGHLAGHPQWTLGSLFSLAGAAAPLCVDLIVTRGF